VSGVICNPRASSTIACAYPRMTVHDDKGARDHVSMWLRSGEPGLQRQLERGTLLHEANWLEGCGAVY